MDFYPLKHSFLLSAITTLFINTCIPVFANTQPLPIERQLAALEASMDGRIGVFAINTTNNQQIQYRAMERFPIQSTFKVMAVSAILKGNYEEYVLHEVFGKTCWLCLIVCSNERTCWFLRQHSP